MHENTIKTDSEIQKGQQKRVELLKKTKSIT